LTHHSGTPRAAATHLDASSAIALLRRGEVRDPFARLVRLAAVAARAPVAVLGGVAADRLMLIGQCGVPEPWASSGQLPLEATWCRFVVERGEPFVADVEREPPGAAAARLENFALVAYCGVPVLVEQQVVAVLSVGDTEPRSWTPADTAVLHELAAAVVRELELLAGASVAAEVESGTGGALATQADSDLAELRSREEHYRRFFEESGTALFVLAPGGVLVDANETFARLIGRPRAELHGTPLAELVVDGEPLERLLAELRDRGAAADIELTLRRPAGDDVVCLMNGGAQAERGAVLYYAAARDITAQKRTEEELVRSALRDPLTALPNRVLFMDRLERLLRHSKRRAGYHFAVLFLDLDNFKVVNDTRGHRVGDRLLTSVARRLESCIRQEDTAARIGGDEFALLLDAVHDAAGVMLVVDRIVEALAVPFSAEGHPAGVTASIGIAMNVSGYASAEELLHDADSAMYRAKASGRNGYVIFDDEMHARALVQRELESDLRDAVVREQFAVHYHPVVDLDAGAVTGLEALLRWAHPERGVLLPADFMPLAEQTGLIVEIGWWVLREACRQLRAWQLECPHAAFRLTMSVNLSARQFVQPDLVAKIDEILAETGLAADCLRLDLTEAVVMQNVELATRLLRELRDRGIQICIDDFGTGFTSLRRLRELPISTLKIDRSFVGQLGGHGTGGEIVQSIIALGRSMAIDAIAEGVETPEQLEQLRRLGTRFAQGFLFSLPLDSQAATRLLQET
jgi:diguanylate cyclase (GGDEF)-like protein/PAS domain S-box-containing protein